MLATLFIVFAATMIIVFILRATVRRYAQYRDPEVPRPNSTTHRRTVAARVYTIERPLDLYETRNERNVSFHRPPPAYNTSDFIFPSQSYPDKEFVIISDKELPTYDDVIKQQEALQSDITINNVRSTNSNGESVELHSSNTTTVGSSSSNSSNNEISNVASTNSTSTDTGSTTTSSTNTSSTNTSSTNTSSTNTSSTNSSSQTNVAQQ